MYLKRLELVGFKSFCNKTSLHFESGITAIVGPNGCGKSNIFDSIRWVLGEQSVKALRGSNMEDVIFNGTDIKEPLGMAEVTLTFDNSRRILNIDQEEVAITRRIFRSGESEYLLNKAVVRLKDIMDLLMGTGIGAESYSLVEQGKIDLVLSSRPEDRRLVFDEAAGVTRYKAQKKETMRKLDETEQNLLRVNDIITEVRRQIASLERQANKARKYKEAFEELKTKEVNWAVVQKAQVGALKTSLLDKIAGLESDELELLGSISQQEARIEESNRRATQLSGGIMEAKQRILTVDNSIHRDRERINFNRERIAELDSTQAYLRSQIEQTGNRIALDEEKLEAIKEEHKTFRNHIAEKTLSLKDAQERLLRLDSRTRESLKDIAETKKNILEIAAKITAARNEQSELTAGLKTHLARQSRLGFEKAKINEEKIQVQANLDAIAAELQAIRKAASEQETALSQSKSRLGQEETGLAAVQAEIESLGEQKISLLSQKEFIEQLKTRYEDIGESLNATVYLDRLPQADISGLVVKIRGAESENLKFSGEAKPIDLDGRRINDYLDRIEAKIAELNKAKECRQSAIAELNNSIAGLMGQLRNHEIAAANKQTYQESVLEQFNRIKDEEDLITLELSDLKTQISSLEDKSRQAESDLAELGRQQKQFEDSISEQQNAVGVNAGLKEKILVEIAQTQTETEGLTKRLASDEATLKILQDTYGQDKQALCSLQGQLKEAGLKQQALNVEINGLDKAILRAQEDLSGQNELLQKTQEDYTLITSLNEQAIGKIDSQKQELDSLKDSIYQLQMQGKDLDFKISAIKDRLMQAYKVDLDNIVAGAALAQATGQDNLSEEINKLKERLDSYGTVNLVAIEEYDELKKRYEFLTQQQNDLLTAKDSLHKAILKINHNAKKMFLDTFELLRVEFRNYFRLLFNGGDAKIFLIDEQDPLESGIEIICRPPGKKLQNVLLLSGGEKSMSAIALIFAVFKVKPAPFCVLDEIDAALDEANVDRFSRTLHDFARESQFLVITHNKKTIANASVMYGITMEESGVSKIVSVKFAKGSLETKSRAPEDIQAPEVAEPEPV